MALFKNFHGFLIDLGKVVALEPVGSFQLASDSNNWKYGFTVRLISNSITIYKAKPVKDASYSEADYYQSALDLREEFVELLKDNGLITGDTSV